MSQEFERGEFERGEFERGASEMRKQVIQHFDSKAAALRARQRASLADGWSIASDLRLSADIADQEQAAHEVGKMPLPEYRPQAKETP